MISLMAAIVMNPLGAVRLTIEPYRQWPACYRLSNGEVEVVVVPQIGRIMKYGFVGGKNVLWEGPLDSKGNPPDTYGWANWGGDKLWIAPQTLMGWPPDKETDGSPQTVKISGKTLILTSSVSKTHGIQFERRITMSPAGSEVQITNRMFNRGSKAIAAAIWQIAQVDDPTELRLPIEKSRDFPKGWLEYDVLPPDSMMKIDGAILKVYRSSEKSWKVGTGSTVGYIESISPAGTFRMSGPFVAGEKFPDNGRAQQVYVNQDPNKYAEMELNSPLGPIASGKSIIYDVKWTLSR